LHGDIKRSHWWSIHSGRGDRAGEFPSRRHHCEWLGQFQRHLANPVPVGSTGELEQFPRGRNG